MAVNYDSKQYLAGMEKYWRAANYLSVGQLYLRNNPLLKRPLTAKDVKVHPLGHWGTIVSQNFIYANLNRAIQKYNLNMFYIEGSGHGGQVMISNSYLDGSYSEIYPNVSDDEKGMAKLFKQFSFPGGVASHAAPETPGSIHEGGELGYSLSHGVGAIFDNPDVIAAVEIGDGESETGPLCASWFSDKFINPVTDGAVLPIINLNGFKISNPTILSRMSDKSLAEYYHGMGWDPHFVEVKGWDPRDHKNDPDDPKNVDDVFKQMEKTMDTVITEIKHIQNYARKNETAQTAKLPRWPMIVVRTPKGWTGPKKNFQGQPVERSSRAHQVPLPISAVDMSHVDALTHWLKSYHPEELFNSDGSVKDSVRNMAPKGKQRMAMNPITNGGIDPKPLRLPDYRKYALHFKTPGSIKGQDMANWSKWIADVMKMNPHNFRGWGPDESESNRLFGVLKETNRQFMEQIDKPNDADIAHSGRLIDSQLSEHQCEGWMEGYALTGRHGFFNTYEAFGRVVDSMLTQHYKWLEKSVTLPRCKSWRRPIPSINVIDTSTAFQQNHNGYTHQDPGLLNHLADKKLDFINEYLPADTNTLLAVGDKAFRQYNTINLLVTSKQPRPQWFSIEEATKLTRNGLGVIDWASTDGNSEPDVVMAASGCEPTRETFAAIDILHKNFPDLKIRCVNVVDLIKLYNPRYTKKGLSNKVFDSIFTKDKPVVFAFHGYENLLKTIFFDRHNKNLHAHGYRENGDITTPFDMPVLNKMDRYDLAKEVVQDVPALAEKSADFQSKMDTILDEHYHYIRDHGTDMPRVVNWKWTPVNNDK